ncbi:MAG: YlxR family protein [Streptosporangiaceae bacterium]
MAAGGEIVPDVTRRLPGRGAYLHPVQGCLARARRRKAIPRALRLPGPLPDGKVAEYLATPSPGLSLPGLDGQDGQTDGQVGPEKAG